MNKFENSQLYVLHKYINSELLSKSTLSYILFLSIYFHVKFNLRGDFNYLSRA